MPKCSIPKLLTYNKLASKIKEIDTGKVYHVEEQFKDYVSEDEKVNGCFRDLREYLPRLAKFYLSVQTRAKTLKWFGKTEGTFLLAWGGDGCPFGKNESACSFLISFLNAGKRVVSSSDNFLVFGANCEETSLVIKKYVLAACKQMADLQGKVYEINGLSVTFSFEEIPNDMKMLAMLGGELNNAATYFSSFGNATLENCRDVKGIFGCEPSCTWNAWSYQERIKTVEAVEKFKESLSKKKVTGKTKRSKITEFIARKKSRQEFSPLIGKLIDKAHAEPLHLKNNAWQYFFKSLLKESISKSNVGGCKSFSEVPADSTFAKVVFALQHEVKAKRVAKKVTKWFDETQGHRADFSYRFTGKDSRLFCHNFMLLIKAMSSTSDLKAQKFRILVLAYIGLRLRDCCSLFNRFDIEEADITKLTKLAREYFRANSLFLNSQVTPTVWTIGHIVPVHTKYMYEVYGQGLLTVSMEGREAKHIALQRLSANNTFQRRWVEIFRHEFIMLVWLPEHGHEPCSNTLVTKKCIPDRALNDPNFCYCGLEKLSYTDQYCGFCSDNLTLLIDRSVQTAKIVPGIF